MRLAGEVAEVVGGILHGDASLRLEGLAPLGSAGAAHLSFLARADHRDLARSSAAGCVLVGSVDELPGRCVIVAQDPYRAFALASRLFHPEARPAAEISTQASVDPTASIGHAVHVAPHVFVGARTRIGDRAVLHAGVVVGDDCEVGDDSVLHPGVVLYARSVLGRRVIVHARAVVGSDGFGYSSGPDGHVKIQHVGCVVVEDDVEIGAGSCIDRAALGETRIGAGTKIDNLVQVGHNVSIGPHCLLVAQSGVAGSTTLGQFVVLAGQSGIAGHLQVGDGARVAAKSALLSDLGPAETVGGIPAIPLATWKRAAAAFAKLPDMLRRLRRLEAAAEGDSSNE